MKPSVLVVANSSSWSAMADTHSSLAEQERSVSSHSEEAEDEAVKLSKLELAKGVLGGVVVLF